MTSAWGGGRGVPKKQMIVLISCVSVTVTRGEGESKILEILRTSFRYYVTLLGHTQITSNLGGGGGGSQKADKRNKIIQYQYVTCVGRARKFKQFADVISVSPLSSSEIREEVLIRANYRSGFPDTDAEQTA